MQVKILGSAAAEAVPALWCECECCKNAKLHGGKDIRRRCSYLINDDMMVDFGPDAFWQSIEFKIDLTKLKHLLFTHSHEDHCAPVDLEWRRGNWYSQINHKIDLAGNCNVLKLVSSFLYNGTQTEWAELHRVNLIEVRPKDNFTMGNYNITALLANHCSGETPLTYVIESNGKKLLIANDTGYYCEESWRQLEGVKLDGAIIECTMGFGGDHSEKPNGHLGIPGTLAFRRRLLEMGCLNGNTPVFCNHFSHNGNCVQAKLEEVFAPHDIVVGYDGLEFEI
ncbi:MAG: MBL fold metallo-hydrolase [Lentisphaeria bacterium]|nr:MBL fold metallo-hydrolase [Lentisphaeria bacterium]